MDRATVNRVLFAIVIVALLVIFVPMLFVAHKRNLNRHIYKIPKPPVLPVYQADTKPAHPALLPSLTTKTIGRKAQPNASPQEGGEPLLKTPAQNKMLKLSLTSSNVAHDNIENAGGRLRQAKMAAAAWVVQLKTFSDQKAADAFVESLRAADITAFSYPNKEGVNVYLGPVLKQAEANELLEKAKKALGAKGVIEKFNAVSLG